MLIGRPFSFFGACADCGGRRGLIGDSVAVTRYISCAEGVKRVGEGSDDVRRGFGLEGGDSPVCGPSHPPVSSISNT